MAERESILHAIDAEAPQTEVVMVDFVDFADFAGKFVSSLGPFASSPFAPQK